MKDKVLEDIAGFMDGELTRERGRFALRRLAQDEQLTEQWQRMHLVRGYLRDGNAQPVPGSFMTDIHARLDEQAMLTDEPNHANEAQIKRWVRPFISTAVAASVAVLALVGINQNVLQQQNVPVQLAESTTINAPATTAADTDFVARSSFLEQQFSAPAVPVTFSNDPQATQRRLNDYLLRHNQLSGNGGRFGFVSYMPLVSGEIVSNQVEANQLNPNIEETATQAVPATATTDDD